MDGTTPLLSDLGFMGDDIVVNGTIAPYLDVTTDVVRLRLLNASNARSYNFGFSDDRAFALIGTDGGLLPQPASTDRIMLSPGERAEIVVDVKAGERTVLRSYPPTLGGGLADRFNGGADRFDVLELRAADTLKDSPAVPAQLVPVDRLAPADATTTRRFNLSGTSINSSKMDASRIDATVTKGSTEIWEITNGDGNAHNFHVHDVQFQVLSIGGKEPPAHLRGWKDTVFATPGQTIRLIMKFADYADANTPYMFHCHVLRHEDAGMMGQFVVVEPGQQAGTPHHDLH
jgi:blue copper oxidase